MIAKVLTLVCAIVCIQGCVSKTKTGTTPASSSVSQSNTVESVGTKQGKTTVVTVVPDTLIKDGLEKAEGTEQLITLNFKDLTVVAPQSSSVTVSVEETSQEPVTKNSSSSMAEGKGVSVSTDSGDLIGNMDLNAPNANLSKDGSGNASGGDSKYSFEVVSKAKNKFFLIFGAGLIAVGVVVWVWLGQLKLGMGLIAAGVLVLGADIVSTKYPWVFLLVFLGIIVAAIFLVRDAWSKRRKELTLATVASSIESSDNEAIKAKISSVASKTNLTTVIKEEIGKVKNTPKFKDMVLKGKENA